MLQETQKSGLSPPKEKKSSQMEEVPSATLAIDRTQWEYTRFKVEAAGLVVTDPDIIARRKIGEASPLLQESRQTMLIKGEHLLKPPWIRIALISIEAIAVVVILVVWVSFASQNRVIPVALCLANLIIALLLLTLVLSIEFARFHVKKEELKDDDYRYWIPYEWKYWICITHILRIFLTCANITMAALDDNYDGGSLSIIAVQPVMILLSLFHVFIAVRPLK
ncbi:unnamed protein product [Caenorhabditis bovis]|uniref:Transmembrane protein n=1 Tax=Caenorhabditis bovis TaxID=2654633 RepID=A0A8S1F7X0_9PELO|nr:unnamed protein product [Caenorhabditis bovis]